MLFPLQDIRVWAKSISKILYKDRMKMSLQSLDIAVHWLNMGHSKIPTLTSCKDTFRDSEGYTAHTGVYPNVFAIKCWEENHLFLGSFSRHWRSRKKCPKPRWLNMGKMQLHVARAMIFVASSDRYHQVDHLQKSISWSFYDPRRKTVGCDQVAPISGQLCKHSPETDRSGCFSIEKHNSNE